MVVLVAVLMVVLVVLLVLVLVVVMVLVEVVVVMAAIGVERVWKARWWYSAGVLRTGKKKRQGLFSSCSLIQSETYFSSSTYMLAFT